MADFSKQRWDKAVQQGLTDGRFVNSAFALIAAGPPRLDQVGGRYVFGSSLVAGAPANQVVYPIGGCQGVTLGQNKAFQRLFEVGSRRSLWLPSHTVQQLQLMRTYFHGASLLRLLYAYYQDLVPEETVPWLFPNLGAANMPNPHDVLVSPGYENVFLNLASDLFDQTFGMLLYLKDSNDATIGAYYLEGSVIPQHNFAIDAMGGGIQESAAVQFEWMVPVQVDALALITA